MLALRGRGVHPREALLICWNRDDGQAYKAVVSLDEDRVVSWEHRPGEQPNVTVDEYHECDAALRGTRRSWRRSPRAASPTWTRSSSTSGPTGAP